MQNLAFQDQPIADGEQQVTFSATGGEYFRIWIVNLLLTIVTLGIYSAWAKVRRNQYFYSSTRLAGSSFEYHGNPVAILKGRIIAVILFAAYSYAPQVSLGWGAVAVLAALAIGPLMMWKSLQFRMYNTSYRGIRFGFNGSVGEAYAHFLLLPMLFGTGILAPLGHHRIKRFQVTESRYGSRQFRFDAPVSRFYAIWIGVAVVGVLGFAGLSALTFAGATAMSPEAVTFLPLLLMLFILALGPLAFCLIQNLVWNHISIGDHEFRCDMPFGRLLWIHFSNLALIIVTLGLATPFAQVRWMKFRLESLTMVVNGALDDFVAAEVEHQGAAGEGVADVFDFDIAL
ncbi:YjgN family protein [Pseudoduganella sp. OTU4001]|uniref:YjgN family protein n=1 Tax=Pseudoduganella sp. OTU4001 TaxID=3043854 RepID=UPI00313EE2C2